MKFAFRQLVKNPGFTAVVVLTLALGIGANTAVFSLVNELLLRPLAVKDANELFGVVLVDRTGDFANQRIPYPILQDYLEQNRIFSELAAYASLSAPLDLGESTRRVPIQLVSSNYFETLGATPIVGRTFQPHEDAVGQAPAVIISHSLWQTAFNSDPGAIGETLALRPEFVPALSCTIVGVAPAGFVGLADDTPDIWLTAAMADHFRKSMSVNFRMLGRLTPGVTRTEAIAALDVVAGNVARKYGGVPLPHYGNEGIFRSDLKTDLRYAARGSWGAFKPHVEVYRARLLGFAVVGLVLLIACANVSNLLLARAVTRRKEIGIRLAIGATRREILRQTLVESALLSVIAGGVGIVFADWLNKLLLAAKPPDLAMLVQTTLDHRVVLFALLVSVLAALIFGMAPAWYASRCDVNAALKDHSAMLGDRRRFQLRDILVVGQISLCLVLLIGAGLCLRSLAELYGANPGFAAKELIVLPLQVRSPTSKSIGPFYDELARQLETLPGVRSVTYSRYFSLLGGGTSLPVREIEGYTRRKDEFINVSFAEIGPNYFETMGIPLLQAPGLQLQQRRMLVWINESFARRYWPGTSPRGKKVGPFVVDGVVADSQIKNLTDPPGPYLYVQNLEPPGASFVLIARTDGNTAAAMAAIRQQCRNVDKDLDLSRLQSMQQLLRRSLLSQRFILLVLGGFALCATLLVMLGIYGVMSYTVTQRTRELGIRLALGAQKWNISGLVLRHALLLASAGIGLGLLGALATTRLLASVLYRISPIDPLTFCVLALALIALAVLASYLPARRAANVDAMESLREG